MGNESTLTEYGAISNEFKCGRLTDLCVAKIGVQTGPFGSQLHKKDYVEIGTPIITVEHLGENRIVHLNTPFVSDEDKQRLSKYLLREGDIVFSRVGSVDRRALVGNQEDGWLFSGRCLRVRVDKSKIDPRFLSYFFGHEGFKNHIRSIAVGATMPSINTKILSDINVYYPDKQEQKAIAHVLGSLDDRIELNRRMNETLEAMAHALFKSWFVDFDPVIDNALAGGKEIPAEFSEKAQARVVLGDKRRPLPEEIRTLFPDEFTYSDELGWIPKGWKIGVLGDYLVVKRGGSPRPIHDYLAPQGLPWVKIADATSSPSRFLTRTKDFIKPEGLSKTVFLKKNSLILSNSATPGLPIFLDLDACIHDGWLYFPETKHFNDLYLYQLFWVVRDKLLSMGSGTIFTNLKTDILKNHTVIVPSKDLLFKFEHMLTPIFGKLHGINAANNQLAKLRDTLLPKLLSGELRIPDAEKMVEELAL